MSSSEFFSGPETPKNLITEKNGPPKCSGWVFSKIIKCKRLDRYFFHIVQFNPYSSYRVDTKNIITSVLFQGPARADFQARSRVEVEGDAPLDLDARAEVEV